MGQVLNLPKPATIEFVVNTDQVIENDNYANFVNNVVPFIKENADQIDSIVFIGSASPEGSKEKNVHLANIRAAKAYSFLSDYVPKSKVVINNDYDLFLSNTGLNEDDYSKLRATYIEIYLKPEGTYQRELVGCDCENNAEREENIVVTEVIDTVFIQKLDRKNNKFHMSFYFDAVPVFYLVPSLGIEASYDNFAVFTDIYYSNWANRNVFDLNAGIRYYFGKDVIFFYAETFFKKNDSNIPYKNLIVDNGLGAGLGAGLRINVNKTIGFGLFARGGWINHSRVKYIGGTKVIINGSNVEVISPSVIDTSKNYFGLFNIGTTLIITL
jgi:hypothetical protein